MRVAIAGGNGFIGRELTRQLRTAGHEVVWLSHRARRVALPPGVGEVAFDAADESGPWRAQIAESQGVVNLSGRPIASRWNPEVKRELRSSRIDTTCALVRAICAARAAGAGPGVFVSASATGVYGEGGEDMLREDSPVGHDWLADLAANWEEAAQGAGRCGVRAVTLRTGLVLGEEGILPRLRTPMRLFVGGPIGPGQQWVPWIHRGDLAGAYRFALEQDGLEGPVNACAPEAVRMSDFARALGRVLGRPSWLRVPCSALRIVLGEVASYIAMSQRVSAWKLLQAGYRFRFATLDAALRDLLGPGGSTQA